MYLALGQSPTPGTAPASLALTRVQRADWIPFRWICRIVTRSHDRSGFSVGTGFLIGPHHVLTAAHVISPIEAPSTASIMVYPGQNGESASGIAANGWAISPGYRTTDCRTVGEDYGIIRLARAVAGGAFSLAPVTPATAANLVVNLAGYPATRDRHARLMFRSLGRLGVPLRIDDCTREIPSDGSPVRETIRATTVANGTLVHHDLDSAKSMSGGPMWILRDGVRTVVALHTGRVAQVRKAILLDATVQARIGRWMTDTLPPLP
ncbi:MAG: trypsin-like peptidase domain-containing protein [Gemmatimonadales bacterium]|nr:trypsin-like peptidase domain-containing protein [Gemmatimonadales bacterium]